MADPVLGIRFDTDRLHSENYRLSAWRVVWDAVGPTALGPARLLSGDTAASLAHTEHVFCIAVQARQEALEALWAALRASPEFQSAAASPPFLDGAATQAEPLAEAGWVGTHGEVLGAWPAAGLNAVREHLAGAPSSAVTAPPVPSPAAAPAAAAVTAPPVPAAPGPPLPPGVTVPPVPAVPPAGPRRRTWLLLAAAGAAFLLVLVGIAVAALTLGRDGPLAERATVEAQLLAMTAKMNLDQFGGSTVTSVTCPADLPDAVGRPFECQARFADGQTAQLTATFVDRDGGVDWCTLKARGEVRLNVGPVTAGLCGDGGRAAATPPAAGPTPAAQPEAQSAGGSLITTAAGALTVQELRLTNRHPTGCVDGQPTCISTAGNRIALLVLDPPPGEDPNMTMNAITAEAFRSEMADLTGGRTPAKQITAPYGDGGLVVVYPDLGVADAGSLILHWPGNEPLHMRVDRR